MLIVPGTHEKITGYKGLKGDCFFSFDLEILQKTYRVFLKPFKVPALNL